MPDAIHYQAKLTTVSPLHIGSGKTLLNEYDFVACKGYTWRINDDALLDAQQVEDPRVMQKLMNCPPGDLLAEADFEIGSPYFRYVVKGVPRLEQAGAELREQIKNSYDQPFIPGSTLKGALRTAIAWKIARAEQLDPTRAELNRRREWAAQSIERQLLAPSAPRGKEPNHDLLRALQIGDSQPADPACLTLINVTVLNRGGKPGAPVELEAIKSDASFTLPIKIDTALFSDWARRQGLKLPHTELLTNLPALLNERAKIQLARELKWYQGITAAGRLVDFYQQLLRAQLPENQCLMQIGWGAGWHSKTLDDVLTSRVNWMESVIREYRMSIKPRREGDPFPKSRRVAILVQRQADGRLLVTPARPLGWVLVELEKAA